MSRVRAGRRQARQSVGRFLQAFSGSAKEQLRACQRAPRQPPEEPLVAPGHAMPTGGRSCWRAGRSRRRCGAGSRPQGFVEVDAAILQVSPGNETHLHAFATELIGSDGARRPLYLHTSPEFACKKLLAAGETSIFTFAPVLPQSRARRPAPSAVHHAGVVSRQCSLRAADGRLRADAQDRGNRGRHRRADVPRPRSPIRSPRRSASRWPKPSSASPASTCSPPSMTTAAMPRRWPRPPSAPASASPATIRWSDVFSRVLLERIEPCLDSGRATILCEYPACSAALARPLAVRPARRRAVRAVCLRRRARQCLRRADRPRRAASPPGGRDGREAAPVRRALSDRRGVPRGARPHAAGQRRGARASTGWSCWRPAPPASSRCCGRRWSSPGPDDEPRRPDHRLVSAASPRV